MKNIKKLVILFWVDLGNLLSTGYLASQGFFCLPNSYEITA